TESNEVPTEVRVTCAGWNSTSWNTASPAPPPQVPSVLLVWPAVEPKNVPLAKTGSAVPQLPWPATHTGTPKQSLSSQSVAPSKSSSRSLLQISGCGGQPGSNTQASSAQSMRPSQSSSSPLLQFSGMHIAQAG